MIAMINTLSLQGTKNETENTILNGSLADGAINRGNYRMSIKL